MIESDLSYMETWAAQTAEERQGIAASIADTQAALEAAQAMPEGQRAPGSVEFLTKRLAMWQDCQAVVDARPSQQTQV